MCMGRASARVFARQRRTRRATTERAAQRGSHRSFRREFDRTGDRCRIAAWPPSRRMCIITSLALLSAAFALASGYALRPAITTHLLVFALGALYGGVMRWKKSPKRTRASRDPKSFGYRARRLPDASPQRRFVKLSR